ncbi:MAG: tRNA uridine-5-carboxymethylaminomethyl(34) synthesis GTPase MnmE [Candidatus Oleimicrobiaceae bacterium]
MAIVMDRDTIVALSTPQGTGALAIVRLSGSEAVQLVEGALVSKRPLRELPSHTITYGRLRGTDETGTEITIDEVMVAVHRGPHSYTGEDLVEITCHGSPLIVQEIVRLFLVRGARLAEPGEFTRRAFLHGRIDLAQAEAVCDLIFARTERARRASMAQLEGRLSRRIASLQQRLADSRALVELEVDFSDEDVPTLDRTAFSRRLDELGAELEAMLATYRQGRFLQQGVRLVLVGRTNVGKSSLLNALLQEDRAIVSELPGTTRDTLEGTVDIGGFPVTVVDTAGFGMAASSVEEEGLRRTEREMDRADVVALVLDGSEPLRADDRRLLALYERGEADGPGVLVVVNKIDLPQAWRATEVPVHEVVEVSAKEGLGLDRLRGALLKLLMTDGGREACDVVVSNVRHWEALRRASEAVSRARQCLADGLSPEFVSFELREAGEALGTIVGAVSDNDVLNSIFAKFCIGK